MGTKLAGDHAQVMVDGYNLTGDHNQISLDDGRNTYDVTAFGDDVQTFIPGQRMIALNHQGYMNPDTARSHPALKGVSVSGAVSVLLGANADPVAGDLAYSMAIRQGRYRNMSQVGRVVPFTAVFATRGQTGGWGHILRVPDSFTDSFNGTSVDNGAASSNGGAIFLHVLTAAASDTYTLVVEGSTTGAFGGEETTLGTFVLDGSSIGSERVALSGTVPQYVRLKATRSGSAGDTVNIAVTLVRF